MKKVIYPSYYLTRIAPLILLSFCLSFSTSSIAQNHSSTIALNQNNTLLLNINKETNSVTLFKTQARLTGNKALKKLAEIPVGQEPSCITVFRNNTAYVTNAASGTVSVIPLRGRGRFSVVKEIAVGVEPLGCALSGDGSKLFVSNHTAGTVSIIDTSLNQLTSKVNVGGKPAAIIVEKSKGEERVYVTEFYAELIPDGPGEGFDDGKRGVVHSFSVNNPALVTKITLSPLANSGFSADRTAFCLATNPDVHDEIFCPDPTNTNPDLISKDIQGAYPNQLLSGTIRNGKLYLPNIGVSPEPPVKFNVNTQALVHVIDTASNTERQDLHVNLNNQIKTETQPDNPTESLDRLFGNDLVAIDCDFSGDFCLIVSRGGNNVLRVEIADDGSLNLNAPNVVRFQTGNIPSGIVIDRRAKRAYVNNEVNVSVSVLDLTSSNVVAQDIPSANPPVPGSFQHRALVGKLVFFTALGTPDNNIAGTDIRDINPLQFRGKASDNGWSDCASCHPRGLADGATWIFPTGPRQTIPLDAFYNSRSPGHHQRISNWSAVRGSITDFNNNSRNVQGGTGFAGNPPNGNIFNHGITQGASEALDLETLWVQTIRPLNMVSNDSTNAIEGKDVFNDNCASCHGGGSWTKSQVFHKDNPAFESNPLAGGQPLDFGIDNAGPQIKAYSDGIKNITILEKIGTFDPANPLEIRGAGAIGKTALGGLGFNVPSLLGVDYHAPYFHDGSAQTLEEVMLKHLLPSGDNISNTIGLASQQNLIEFLKTIDARVAPVRSEGDDFRDPIAEP